MSNDKKKKSHVRLVYSNKDEKYESVSVYLCDGSIDVFDLLEWDYQLIKDEWFELYKKDETSIVCYYVYQVLKVVFQRGKLVDGNTNLKPVA